MGTPNVIITAIAIPSGLPSSSFVATISKNSYALILSGVPPKMVDGGVEKRKNVKGISEIQVPSVNLSWLRNSVRSLQQKESETRPRGNTRGSCFPTVSDQQ